MIAAGHPIQTLPLQQELETRAVLKAVAAAHRRLAELKVDMGRKSRNLPMF